MLSATSDRLVRISDQFHHAVITAIAIPPISKSDTLLPDILYSLTTWKSRPDYLTWMAYEWCSVICEQCTDLGAAGGLGRTLLFLSLEIGFRHLDFRNQDVGYDLNFTDHHQRMVDVVFEDGSGEVIADFLHARTSRRLYCYTPYQPFHVHASHLIDLQRLQPLSPRLRHLLILSISLLDYQAFEQFGSEKLFELLDHLRIRVEDAGCHGEWAGFLLSIIRSPEGIRRLSYPYWELLVERTILGSKWLRYEAYDEHAHIMESLEDAEEWDRLECWIGFLWVSWGPVVVVNLESVTLLLFCQQPGGILKVERWVERRQGQYLESFRSLCERLRLSDPGQRTL